MIEIEEIDRLDVFLLIPMSDISSFIFRFGFLWLYVFIFHRPEWICNRIRDVEKTLVTVVTDFISISIIVIFFQTFRLIIRSLRPIVVNLIYPFGKASSDFLQEIQNEIIHLSILFERTTIDSLILILDNAFFHPIKEIYLDSIEPEILMPILIPIFTWIEKRVVWIEKKGIWIEDRVLFIKYLKKFHIRFWKW